MNMHEFLAERRLVPEGKRFADRRGWDGDFTAMQNEVVDTEAFWAQDRNIVIHGPTSSGKTLLAEIAALHQIREEERKVLFLVPLRVLVTSHCRQLQRDFEQIQKADGSPLDIFESSADYQDHDAQILSGEYDIAVIVYEKFFALLNNLPNHMLDNCGLIVVDELQMLSSADRGPKMEFSIMKILETQQEMRSRGESIRIIGITTSESGVDHVCDWLNAESLGNDIRPVPLMQHFVSCRLSTLTRLGEIWPWPAADGAEQPQDPQANRSYLGLPPEGHFGTHRNASKNRCFFALLNRWMEPAGSMDGSTKILIFSNAKNTVRTLANEIAKRYPLFTSPPPENAEERKTLADAMDDALEEFRDEDDISNLRALISHGVAFHHSGLPSTVREAIEEDFRSNSGRIQVIVCTNTLMIGVNLPADVVILYDNTVYRGDPLPSKLSLQEYQNYIGRAGRLGMNTHGESYMLTERLRQDFTTYTSGQKTEIASPFHADRPAEIAPYFMSWIGPGGDAGQRIRFGLEQGFCCSQRSQDDRNIAVFAQGILDELKKLRRENTDGSMLSLIEESSSGLEPVWTLTRLGEYLAPYALTLDTDDDLLDYVIHHRDRLHRNDLKPAPSQDQEPLPSAALLELLYTICRCAEVDKNPSLKPPANDNQVRELDRNLKGYLRRIYPSRPLTFDGTQGRPLPQLAHAESVLEDPEIRAATRAVILALWMTGCTVCHIRTSTRFNLPISTSDLERLSETVAYLMEAVSNCQKVLGMDEEDFRWMYALSTSMKYGVPYNVVPLANTHARGVTRPFLLKLRNQALSAGKTPVEYALASSGRRYAPLQNALRAREKVPNYAQQLQDRALEIDTRFSHLLSILTGFEFASNPDAALIFQSLKAFFENLCDIRTEADAGIQVHEPREQTLQVVFIRGGQICQLYFQTLRPASSDNGGWVDSMHEFTQYAARQAATANIPNTRAITVLCDQSYAEADNLQTDHLVISSEMLGVLLLACLTEPLPDVKNLICRILSDLQGCFLLNGSGFFSGFGQLWDLVKAYSIRPVHPAAPQLQLFYYPGIFDLNGGTLSASKEYVAFPWGQEEAGGSHKRVAFYHSAMQFSRQCRITLQHSSIIWCSEDDTAQVHELVHELVPENSVIYTKGPDMEMDHLLHLFAERLTAERPAYTYDIGISFRGFYEPQMNALRQELEQRGKSVLFMSTDDFAQGMGGDNLHARLREYFSACRHIIACDTADYDQSTYTLVEYNVIVDKLALALQENLRIPVYLVRIPGVAPSEKLSNFFRYNYTYTFDENDVPHLADILIGQICNVEQDIQHADPPAP